MNARELASGYLNGDLDEQHVLQVDAHLGNCACCPPVLQVLQGVVAALASAPETAPIEGLLDALRAAIARARGAGT